MSCEFAHLDGSYVLGALAPGERQEFEDHLSGCPQCARAVQELAGMPGLLARVDPETLESPEIPMPDTLLPALVRQARRVEHRRTVTTALLSAAAVTVVAAGLVATGVIGDGNPPGAVPRSAVSSSAAPTAGRDMIPVVAGPVRASVGFVTVPWGTRLDLTCTYDAAYQEGGRPPGSYVLVVRTRDGRTEQVGAWRALPGTMRLSAATDASRGDIASVEVRTATGSPVLRLPA